MRELSVLGAAKDFPTRDCLITDGAVWSYADVAERVRAALGSLQGREVQSGDRVALTPETDVDSVVWLYALFELGCPAVLLHPRWTDRERADLLEETRPAHVITEPVPKTAPSEIPTVPSVPAHRCLAIVYTSGTRGKPRGAQLSRKAFVASHAAHAANLGWRPRDRWFLCIPPAHVGGLSILTRSLIARRSVVLSSGPFDAPRVIQALDDQEVTLLSVVPTMLQRLLACEEPRWTPGPHLRAVLVGGAPFPDALREQSTARGVPVIATYGCTEACSQVTTQHMDQSGQPGCGFPLEGVKVRLQDGEVQVFGDTLMNAQVGDPSDNPWTADGWLRTGDTASFLSDGQLLVSGRLDDVIVTGGENVAPAEVEAWLESVPGISAACVFSMPHREWGEEVVAALVIEPALFEGKTLQRQLAQDLASHKRPKRICTVESLPLNRSGKLDRNEVRIRCAELLRPI